MKFSAVILTAVAMVSTGVMAVPTTVDPADLIPIVYKSIDERAILSRQTRHCANTAKITRAKENYGGSCHPDRSIGFQSAHNCDGRGGSSYLCVQGGSATCYTNLKWAKKAGLENGECFL